MLHHPHRQCLPPFHRHSGKEASRSEADLELGLVLAEVVEQELVPELELEEMAARVLVLAEEGDRPLAIHMCRSCTSFPCRTSSTYHTPSHIGGRECCKQHCLSWFLLGSQLGIRHQNTCKKWHKSHLNQPLGEESHPRHMEAGQSDRLALGQELEALVSEEGEELASELVWALVSALGTVSVRSQSLLGRMAGHLQCHICPRRAG